MLPVVITMTTACANNKETKAGTYSDSDIIKQIQSIKNPDYWPTEQWKNSTPKAQGMDSELLAGIVKQLLGTNIHTSIRNLETT